RSSRAQCDKLLYARTLQEFLKTVPRLQCVSSEVVDIIEKRGIIQGVSFPDGSLLKARSVVITSGTFLAAVMHPGEKRASGGRFGEGASWGLSEALKRLGFRLRRLKTGTPPRLHKDSI